MGKKKSAFVREKEGFKSGLANVDPAGRLRPIKEARVKEEKLTKQKESLPYSSKRRVPGCGATLQRRPAHAVESYFDANRDFLISCGVESLPDLVLFMKVRFSPAYHLPKSERGAMDLPCVERKLSRDIKRYYVTPPKLPWSNPVREAYTRQVRDFIKSGENQLVAGCVSLETARERRNEADGNVHGHDSLRQPRLPRHPLAKSQLNGANGEKTGKDDVDPLGDSAPTPPQSMCGHPWCNGIIIRSGNRLLYIIPHFGLPFLRIAYEPMADTHVAIELDDEPCESMSSDDCHCCLCVRDTLHDLHVVASQINGSHGEYTGSDDLDRQNAARRLNQAARNHQHQRPIPHGRADPDDYAERPVGRRRNRQHGAAGGDVPLAEVHVAPVVEEVVPILTFYVESFGSIFVDGVLRPPGDLPIVQGDMLVQNVVSTADGVICTQADKGAPGVTAPILAELTIPAYSTPTDTYPPETYLVFYPLLRMLQKQLAGKQSSNTPFACSSLAQRHYPRLPVSEALSTTQYFVHLNEYANAKALRGNNLFRRMLGVAVEPSVLMANQIMELQLVHGMLPVTPGEFVRAQAGQCAALDNYPLRTDFIVSRSQGTTWDEAIRTTPTLEANGYFAFNTADGRDRWYRTQFFSLNGLGQQPFVHYDNTGHNAAKGLKRLVGGRLDQFALQAAQQSLIPVLLDVLMETCSCNIVDAASNYRGMLQVVSTDTSGTTQRHGLRLDPIPDFADPEQARLALPIACQPWGRVTFDVVQREIARLHAKMILMTTRSTVQRLLDGTMNGAAAIKDYVYDKPFKALGEFFAPDQQRFLNAEIPHVNRGLRQQYVNGVLTHLDEDIMVRRLDAQVKNETAKFGKASRLYVSYGAGSMFANDLPDYVKKCIAGTYELGEINGLVGYVIMVNSPKQSALSDLFVKSFQLHSLPNTYLGIAWSDDMNEMANLGGQLYGANTDVESNDSSNGAYPFAVYGTCMANYNPLRAGGILRQCMEPVSLRNPSNSDEVLKVSFVGPNQGSGTCATTGLNNVNSTGTCVGTFVYLAYAPWTKQGFIDSIAAGAAACGHSKSVEMCEYLGDFSSPKVQFLKHSPMRCTRGHETSVFMVQNLGCILRNLGKVDGDLTAQMIGVTPMVFSTGMSDDERADRFFTSVVNGLKNSPTCPIIKALRLRFCHKSATVAPVKYQNVESDLDLSGWEVSTEDLIIRYGFSEAELNELVSLISRIQVGYTYTCAALAKIYSVDYGVPI